MSTAAAAMEASAACSKGGAAACPPPVLRLNTGLCDCTLPLLAAAPVVRLPDHVHHYASRLPGALLPHKARRHLHGGAILLQAQPFDVCVRADALRLGGAGHLLYAHGDDPFAAIRSQHMRKLDCGRLMG